MTNKEFKASDKNVIRANPIAFFFLLLFVQKQSMLVLYSNSSPRKDSAHLKLENFNYKSLSWDDMVNLDICGWFELLNLLGPTLVFSGCCCSLISRKQPSAWVNMCKSCHFRIFAISHLYWHPPKSDLLIKHCSHHCKISHCLVSNLGDQTQEKRAVCTEPQDME